MECSGPKGKFGSNQAVIKGEILGIMYRTLNLTVSSTLYPGLSVQLPLYVKMCPVLPLA